MIHRAVLGSIERMFAILLEHYKGIWPFWLSPRQAIVCSLSEDYSSYAKQVQKQIQEAGYYVDIDESDRSICKKVADARAAPYNYILVVGQKEATTGQVTVRLREDPAGRKDLPEMSIDSLLDEFKFKTSGRVLLDVAATQNYTDVVAFFLFPRRWFLSLSLSLQFLLVIFAVAGVACFFSD